MHIVELMTFFSFFFLDLLSKQSLFWLTVIELHGANSFVHVSVGRGIAGGALEIARCAHITNHWLFLYNILQPANVMKTERDGVRYAAVFSEGGEKRPRILHTSVYGHGD